MVVPSARFESMGKRGERRGEPEVISRTSNNRRRREDAENGMGRKSQTSFIGVNSVIVFD